MTRAEPNSPTRIYSCLTKVVGVLRDCHCTKTYAVRIAHCRPQVEEKARVKLSKYFPCDFSRDTGALIV